MPIKPPTLTESVKHLSDRARKPTGAEMSASGRRWLPATLVRIDCLKVVLAALRELQGDKSSTGDKV